MKSLSGVISLGILAFVAHSKGAVISNDGIPFSPPSNVNVATAIEMYYMALQQIMPCGYQPFGLPPMAPFTMENYTFSLQDDSFSINGSISNIVVTGMDNFVLLKSNFDTEKNRAEFDFFQPAVQVLAEAEINAWVMVAGYPVPGSFKGVVNMKSSDSRSLMGFTIEPNTNNPQGIQFSDIKTNVMLGDIIFNNWNRNYDIAANNFLNKWLRESTLLLVQEMQPKLSNLISGLIQPLNKDLAYVSMSDMINYLVQQSMLMTEAANSCTKD